MKRFIPNRFYSSVHRQTYEKPSAKDKNFYQSENQHRRYYYFFDSKGFVHQEASKHRNFVTALKDQAFLRMCFGQLRLNDSKQHQEYAFYFPCGLETNFVYIDDEIAASTFGSSITDSHGQMRLTFGHSPIQHSFSSQHLYVDEETGRFYHEILEHKYLQHQLALLNHDIVQRISHQIIATTDGKYLFKQDGKEYEIKPVVKEPS